MAKKLYEIIEEKSNEELAVLVKEMLEFDKTGYLNGQVKRLIVETPNCNYNTVRAELNYEVFKRFADIFK